MVLGSNHLLNNAQYGGRKSRLTTETLVHLDVQWLPQHTATLCFTDGFKILNKGHYLFPSHSQPRSYNSKIRIALSQSYSPLPPLDFSRFLLTALDSPSPKIHFLHSLVTSILTFLTTFLDVPDHKRIPSSEQIDSAAKEATNFPRVKPFHQVRRNPPSSPTCESFTGKEKVQ